MEKKDCCVTEWRKTKTNVVCIILKLLRQSKQKKSSSVVRVRTKLLISMCRIHVEYTTQMSVYLSLYILFLYRLLSSLLCGLFQWHLANTSRILLCADFMVLAIIDPVSNSKRASTSCKQ